MVLKQFNQIGSTPSEVVEIQHELLRNKQVRLWVKREDLIHPIISGNKWRKLKFHLQVAIHNSAKKIVSIGGDFSNHLHALAYAGKVLNIPTVGLIKGYNIDWNNPCLTDCRKWGMSLSEINKEKFHTLQFTPQEYKGSLHDYFVPMGGTDQLGMKGVIEMANEIGEFDHKMNFIAVPFGSGGTMAGLIAGIQYPVKILGFSSFNGKWETDLINKILPNKTNLEIDWEVTNKYRMGGFAKYNNDLIDFIHWFEKEFGFPLDHIYNGKMMFGLWEMIKNDHFIKATNLMAIHTGGIQGRRGLNMA